MSDKPGDLRPIRHMETPVSQELEAIGRCVDALKPLDDEAVRRAMTYLNSRFNVRYIAIAATYQQEAR